MNIATMLGSDKRREGARAKAQFFVGRFFRGLKAAIPGLKSGASTRRAKAQFFVGRFLRGLKAAVPGLKSGASTRRAKVQFFVGRFLRGLKAAIPGLKSGASTGDWACLPGIGRGFCGRRGR